MYWRLFLGILLAAAVLFFGETPPEQLLQYGQQIQGYIKQFIADNTENPYAKEPEAETASLPKPGEKIPVIHSGRAEITYKVVNDWGTGMESRITIKNKGWTTLQNWTLLFGLPRQVESVKGALFTAQAGWKYRFDSPATGWNSRIAPGQTIHFTMRSQPGNYQVLPNPMYLRLSSIPTTTGMFNYAEALQMSLYFYEAQRSGKLPPNNRVKWRGDSAVDDGMAQGIDLSGGYYDAGDHMKFGLPMFSSVTLLAWGGLEYGKGYRESGQWQQLLDTVRWGTDWILKAHTQRDELWVQVGEGARDHAFWITAEQMTERRTAFKVDPAHPGSDVAGEAAAALAAASLLFVKDDPAYSMKLLEHAKDLFDFADSHRGIYSDSIKDAAKFYESKTGYGDELTWAAAWLYRATRDPRYLEKAESYYKQWLDGTTLAWTMTWDDKRCGAAVLLAELTGKGMYRRDAEMFLDFWTVGYENSRVTYTPGGLAFLQGWGSLRYAANTALLAFIYSDKVMDYGHIYHVFAKQQINYILGNNPQRRSYVVGFGHAYPMNPHHRGAHDSPTQNIEDPVFNKHILYGALVGGPDKPNDASFLDDRRNERTTEVALDYNAGFSGALAKMVIMYGGTPLKAFPPVEKP